MTAIALQRRLKGSGVTVSSLHPGIVSTDITRSSEDIKVMKILAKIDHKVGEYANSNLTRCSARK